MREYDCTAAIQAVTETEWNAVLGMYTNWKELRFRWRSAAESADNKESVRFRRQWKVRQISEIRRLYELWICKADVWKISAALVEICIAITFFILILSIFHKNFTLSWYNKFNDISQRLRERSSIMRTIEYFRRMLSIIYIYSAGLILADDTKRLKGAPKLLQLTTKRSEGW